MLKHPGGVGSVEQSGFFRLYFTFEHIQLLWNNPRNLFQNT